jgi:uncharacterized protein YdeI (YjbR/CyaY-like superfamily)
MQGGSSLTFMMITDIEDYFGKGCGRCGRFDTPECSARQWAEGLHDLRRICIEAGLVETVKWGHPCYMRDNRNIVILGAFRENFRLTFFNSALMKDPHSVLQKQGPNTPHPDAIQFTKDCQVAEMETVIRSYLREAIGYAEAGLKPPKQEFVAEMPDELVDALDSDPELAEAFRNLTPGRQKSYLINLNSTKKPETRTSRIGKFRPHIIAGKGALER